MLRNAKNRESDEWCPAITRKGLPCLLYSDQEHREGYCHVHDPNGKYQRQLAAWRTEKKETTREYKRRKKEEKVVQKQQRLEELESRGLICLYIEDDGIKCKKQKGQRHAFCKKHRRIERSRQRRNGRYKKKRKRRLARPLQDGECVYIFSLGFDSLYKIGHSIKPERRLAALRAANPRMEKVSVVGVINSHAVEKALHSQLDAKRVEREIFRLTPDELAWAKNRLNEYAKGVT